MPTLACQVMSQFTRVLHHKRLSEVIRRLPQLLPELLLPLSIGSDVHAPRTVGSCDGRGSCVA